MKMQTIAVLLLVGVVVAAVALVGPAAAHGSGPVTTADETNATTDANWTETAWGQWMAQHMDQEDYEYMASHMDQEDLQWMAQHMDQADSQWMADHVNQTDQYHDGTDMWDWMMGGDGPAQGENWGPGDGWTGGMGPQNGWSGGMGPQNGWSGGMGPGMGRGYGC